MHYKFIDDCGVSLVYQPKKRKNILLEVLTAGDDPDKPEKNYGSDGAGGSNDPVTPEPPKVKKKNMARIMELRRQYMGPPTNPRELKNYNIYKRSMGSRARTARINDMFNYGGDPNGDYTQNSGRLSDSFIRPVADLRTRNNRHRDAMLIAGRSISSNNFHLDRNRHHLDDDDRPSGYERILPRESLMRDRELQPTIPLSMNELRRIMVNPRSDVQVGRVASMNDPSRLHYRPLTDRDNEQALDRFVGMPSSPASPSNRNQGRVSGRRNGRSWIVDVMNIRNRRPTEISNRGEIPNEHSENIIDSPRTPTPPLSTSMFNSLNAPVSPASNHSSDFNTPSSLSSMFNSRRTSPGASRGSSRITTPQMSPRKK